MFIRIRNKGLPAHISSTKNRTPTISSLNVVAKKSLNVKLLTGTVTKLIYTKYIMKKKNYKTQITYINYYLSGIPTHSRNNVIKSHSLTLSHLQFSFRGVTLGRGASSPWRSYKDDIVYCRHGKLRIV